MSPKFADFEKVESENWRCILKKSTLARTQNKIELGIAALICAVFFAWVVFQTFRPPPGTPTIFVKLVGFTNDVSGGRLAIIAVTNLSSFKIQIGNPRIEIPAPTWAFYPQSYLGRWSSVLGGGEGGSFTISPPTNQAAWKISFWVQNDVGLAEVIQRHLAGRLFGVPRSMPVRIESTWLEGRK